MESKEPENAPADRPRSRWSRFWHWMWRPPERWWLLGVPSGALILFLIGIIFTVSVLRPQMRFTESQDFCTSCHEMEIPYAQLKHSFHFYNEFGIRPTCADCHLPPRLGPRLLAHFAARADVWSHLTGKIDTPEKFAAYKMQMAKIVWADLKAQDSAPCKRCHNYDAMALEKQSHSAQVHHSKKYREKTGKTCIDCHKGVAHELPDGM